MAPVGADGVRWTRAKVSCARCIKDERDCWVASNRRARACEACIRTHISCSRAVGWGQDEGWPTGPTITIKRKVVEEPKEEKRKEKEKEVKKEQVEEDEGESEQEEREESGEAALALFEHVLSDIE